MKYIILIGDGMADDPLPELDGRTVMEAARTPNMDRMADQGTLLGLFKSVPDGYPPGSDVANLSLLGYDPAKYYTGRAPLEAASMGIELAQDETAFRCNLVSLTSVKGKANDAFVMADYSAGHISTEEAAELIKTLDKALKGEGVRFYPGKQYRHLMVMAGVDGELDFTPPHDISDKEITNHLPRGEGAKKRTRLMELSRDILKDHLVNVKRRADGKGTADSIWLWGHGVAPRMETYKDRFGLDGAIISAVDLMNGIGVYAGLEVISVPGATGYLDTNFKGKAEYAIDALKSGKDFVCVHVEAPDEAGHQGLLDAKIKAIEDFDALTVGTVLDGLDQIGEARVVVTCDHATPVKFKTHTAVSVPFAIYEKGGATGEKGAGRSGGFSEKTAREAGLEIVENDLFIDTFLRNSADNT